MSPFPDVAALNESCGNLQFNSWNKFVYFPNIKKDIEGIISLLKFGRGKNHPM
jgi:hypothetical protein